ncbi:hypothetical protein BH10PLA2_BH10PLA2_12890 [soil metagenome]
MLWPRQGCWGGAFSRSLMTSYLNVRQVAERIGCSLALVYRWCETRQLAHFRIGAKNKRGRIRVDEADLEAFVTSLKVEGATVAEPPAPISRLRHLSL